MNNIPKSTELWSPLVNSVDYFHGPDVSSREDSECFKFISNKTTGSVWHDAPSFDSNNRSPSTKTFPPESLFPDLSLPWSARPLNKLWSPSGVAKVDWSMSSKSPWQNGTFEDDNTKSPVATSFPTSNSDEVPPTTSCDNVFQNIWSPTLDRRLLGKNGEVWNSFHPRLVSNTKPSDSEPDRTGTLTAETSLLSTNQPQSSTQELGQDQQKAQLDKSVNAIGDKVTDEEHDGLISQLVNTTEGWGSRGIDQSTTWDSAMEEEKTTDGTNGRNEPVFLTSHQLSNRQQESNVWTNEPPTGTGIWESHYEQMASKTARLRQQEHETLHTGIRNTSPSSVSSPRPLNSGPFIHQQPISQSVGTDFVFWSNRTGGTPQGHVAPPLSHFDSSAAGIFGSAFCRPVLGGSSSSRPSDEGNLSLDANWPGQTGWPPIDSNDRANWMSVAVNKSAPLFPPSNDLDQQPQNSDSCGPTTLGVHPYSHTYRADLVRYFIQLGYRKEEVQAVLIECNMDIDRSLALLRQRYRSTGIFRPPFSQRTLSSGQVGPPPVFGRGVTGPPVRSTSGGGRGLPVNSHTFTALNNGKMTGQGQDSFSVSQFSSLLGLPPPQENTPSSSSTTTAIRGRIGHWIPSPTAHPSPLLSVADLHKKRQEIVRQMQLYRNNAALCSQPQYTALLNELSAQLQHVESQLCAKEATGYASPALCGVVDAAGADDGRSFNSASLTHRLQEMRILGGGGGSPSINPPSPRPGYKPSLNGFRNPRGGDGWLMIRCPPTATSAFESILSQMSGFLQFHNLERSCICLARFISPETAMEAIFQLGVGGSSAVSVDLIAERHAQVLLMDAIVTGK